MVSWQKIKDSKSKVVKLLTQNSQKNESIYKADLFPYLVLCKQSSSQMSMSYPSPNDSTSKAKADFLPSLMDTKQDASTANGWLVNGFIRILKTMRAVPPLPWLRQYVWRGFPGLLWEQPWGGPLASYSDHLGTQAKMLTPRWKLKYETQDPPIWSFLGTRSENQWSPHTHVEFTMKPLTEICACQSCSFKINVDTAAIVAAETSSILPQTSPGWH